MLFVISFGQCGRGDEGIERVPRPFRCVEKRGLEEEALLRSGCGKIRRG